MCALGRRLKRAGLYNHDENQFHIHNDKNKKEILRVYNLIVHQKEHKSAYVRAFV
jgi:hypothetical protein